MPAYFLTNILSDVASTYLMAQITAANSIVVDIAGSGSATVSFITPIPYPNNNNYTTTSATLVVGHSVTNKNITVSAQIHRVNSSGTIQSSGTAASAQTTAATNTFNSLDEPTWSTTCGDRVLLRLTYTNSSMSSQSCTLAVNNSLYYLQTSIPHNGGTCPVSRKPLVMMSL